VLDELTQNPPIVEGGKHKRMPVLSGETEVLMPEPAGKVIAYYIKHSEAATMAEYIGKGTKNVSFRIGFPASDFATFKTDRKSTRLNSSHNSESRMPSSA
jgi:saccharopine dehydrogenase-like NADP-dependent oxidoreductase